MSALGSISALSLREQAARAIRTGIITGEITPGEPYSVRALSTQLGVSPTPVREAMLDLEGEGLLVSERNRGFRVRSLSPEDVDNVLRLRLLLEVPSMGDVAESHRDEDLAPFVELADKLPTFVEASNLQGYLDADQEFHLGLLGLLGNARLVDIVRMLRHHSRLHDVGRLNAVDELIESAREHRPILEAIEQRDRKRTEDLVTNHLVRAREISADKA